jgi:phosphatidylinositol alpha-1,6-mannosyltransferase
MSKVLVVSAGFDADGGGRAAAGRLLAGALGELAAARGLSIAALALGSAGSPIADTRYFGRRRAALALAVGAAQVAEPALVLAFDLLGLARVQPLVPRPWRRPYLVQLHGIEAWKRLPFFRRAAVRGAHGLLAVSQFTADAARRVDSRVSPSTLHLALTGTPRQHLPEVREARGGTRVLIVGRLAASERYKGHDQLLAALAWLREAALREGGAPPPIELVVAGDGDDRPRLEAEAARLGVTAQVRFTGFLPAAALDRLYAEADVFAMPSTGEGFGLVFLEAMRAGLPCVALADTAPAEIVRHEETGLLVPANDVAALAAGLARLAGNPDLRQRLGAAGREREQSVFSRERFVAGLAPHLDRLLAALPAAETAAAANERSR